MSVRKSVSLHISDGALLVMTLMGTINRHSCFLGGSVSEQSAHSVLHDDFKWRKTFKAMDWVDCSGSPQIPITTALNLYSALVLLRFVFNWIQTIMWLLYGLDITIVNNVNETLQMRKHMPSSSDCWNWVQWVPIICRPARGPPV